MSRDLSGKIVGSVPRREAALFKGPEAGKCSACWRTLRSWGPSPVSEGKVTGDRTERQAGAPALETCCPYEEWCTLS